MGHAKNKKLHTGHLTKVISDAKPGFFNAWIKRKLKKMWSQKGN
jgi:hypothetical protein